MPPAPSRLALARERHAADLDRSSRAGRRRRSDVHGAARAVGRRNATRRFGSNRRRSSDSLPRRTPRHDDGRAARRGAGRRHRRARAGRRRAAGAPGAPGRAPRRDVAEPRRRRRLPGLRQRCWCPVWWLAGRRARHPLLHLLAVRHALARGAHQVPGLQQREGIALPQPAGRPGHHHGRDLRGLLGLRPDAAPAQGYPRSIRSPTTSPRWPWI